MSLLNFLGNTWTTAVRGPSTVCSRYGLPGGRTPWACVPHLKVESRSATLRVYFQLRLPCLAASMRSGLSASARFFTTDRPAINFFLSPGFGNCYKVRVRMIFGSCWWSMLGFARKAQKGVDGRRKALGDAEKRSAGTAAPVSAMTDLCTISVSEWMPATL
jgi:hypothetical protein